MINNELRHFQRERKKERKEGDSAVERSGGNDKHEQLRNLGRWIKSTTVGINSKGICSYNRSFRVFFLLVYKFRLL